METEEEEANRGRIGQRRKKPKEARGGQSWQHAPKIYVDRRENCNDGLQQLKKELC